MLAICNIRSYSDLLNILLFMRAKDVVFHLPYSVYTGISFMERISPP